MLDGIFPSIDNNKRTVSNPIIPPDRKMSNVLQHQISEGRLSKQGRRNRFFPFSFFFPSPFFLSFPAAVCSADTICSAASLQRWTHSVNVILDSVRSHIHYIFILQSLGQHNAVYIVHPIKHFIFCVTNMFSHRNKNVMAIKMI